MRKVVGALSFAALAVAVLAWPAAMVLDRAAGRDLLLISNPRKPEDVDLERALRSKGQPVADLYGQPANRVERFLFVDPADVVHPREDPSLALYVPGAGKHPVQAQTAYYVAVRVLVGALAAAAAGFAFLFLRGRKPAPAA